MKKLHIVLFVVLWLGFFSLPVLQTGCTTTASERVKQVQTLKGVGHTAEAAVAASAQLYAAKQITDAQARDVINIYNNKFQPAYRIAVNAVNANLDSIASPELISIAAQMSALILTYQNK